MAEIEVKIAHRYIKRKSSNAVGKSIIKTLAEPITNSDDNYRIMTAENESFESVYPIFIYIDKRNRSIKIIDNAEGMMAKELEAKFKEYGAAKSGAYKGYATRGLFGQGISDVLFYHSDGVIKSIKNGEASVCNFYEKRDKRFINAEKQNGSAEKFAKLWGINSSHGTLVEFKVDKETIIHEYDNLVKKLSTFYMIRLINANEKRKIVLFYTDNKGNKKQSVIKYHFPEREFIGHKELTMQFENYDPVKVDVVLYKTQEPLQTVGEERENGLLVSDDKETVYDLTFFGLDYALGVDRFYGFVKLTGIREIILDKINDKKRPEEILTDSRDGFNEQHEFYKQLEGLIKDWLYPILTKEKRRVSDAELSEYTKENHKKAFDELNKLYTQLTGEDSGGTIRVPKKERPAGGIEFARDNISLTANKRYGLQLAIDTRIIKPGAVIKLNSNKNKIGFTPLEINVVKPNKDANDILVKTVIITGNTAGDSDTLRAEYKNYRASVVISIVPQEIIYPENGLSFNPDYFRAVVDRESTLNLYIDVGLIKHGSKIKLTSSNNSIKLTISEIEVVGQIWATNKVTKLKIPFIGEKNNEIGTIEATFKDYSAQARVEIKDRISSKPSGLSGKFRNWDFDEKVPVPFQAIYDSGPTSPTNGYILINPNHLINKKYFGENPKKSDTEESLVAQLYSAELILNESLNVVISEAIQKGTLPPIYGQLSVIYYVAQKKHEYGPSIYRYFVGEKSLSEVKREKLIEEVKQVEIPSDKDLIEGMEEREKQMTEMRFGLNEQRPHTLEEIGDKFGITRERVRQIINSALAKKLGNYFYSDSQDYIKKYEDKIDYSIKGVIESVASFFKLTTNDIKEKTRKSEIVKPRQIAMYLLRDVVRLSYPSISRIFKCDHTTVLYAFEKTLDRINFDVSLKNQIDTIKNIISNPPKEDTVENKDNLNLYEKENISIKNEHSNDFLKIRIEDVNFSSRTLNALSMAGIRTLGGLARKKTRDLYNIRGLGKKGVNQINKILEKSEPDALLRYWN